MLPSHLHAFQASIRSRSPDNISPDPEHAMNHDEQACRLISLTPVGTWSWVLAADQCSICRNSLMALCMKCQASQTQHTNCAVSWGDCNHAFHKHCIDDWIKSRAVCPIDESRWHEKQVADIIS